MDYSQQRLFVCAMIAILLLSHLTCLSNVIIDEYRNSCVKILNFLEVYLLRKGQVISDWTIVSIIIWNNLLLLQFRLNYVKPRAKQPLDKGNFMCVITDILLLLQNF